MKLATPRQMNSIDSHAINSIGIPGVVLMENAALRVVEAAADMLGELDGKRITILAGKGNNGGDALAAARHLHGRGALCFVFLLSEKTGLKGDALLNLGIAERIGLKVTELLDTRHLRKLTGILKDTELVIDGIYGTGLKGDVEGLAADVIKAVNSSPGPVLSIDIPSGICGDTGKIRGCCIKADRTVTFGLPKVGLAVHPGCDYTGRLDVADIGLPAVSVEQAGIGAWIIDKEQVCGMLPPRPADSHKGDFGKILLLTGSPGMTGSGCLCAEAALRTGAGLVYLGVPASLAHIYGSAVFEPVLLPMADGGAGKFAAESADAVLKALQGKDAVAAGPGMSVNGDIEELVRLLLRECRAPLVLDADALNAVSRDLSMLGKHRAEVIITPHPAEMARLSGIPLKEVIKDRIGTARSFSAKWSVITVLKGSRTVVALPDGSYYVNTTGNPGMATGGSGDVLTGIIASLAGQGMKPADAAVAGVYIHGRAGDETALRLGRHGMLPGDMVRELPAVMKELYEA